MSLSLTWKPVDPNIVKTFGGGSSLCSAMVDAFGQTPFIIKNTEKNIGKLEGMISCGHKQLDNLISNLEEYGSIEIDTIY